MSDGNGSAARMRTVRTRWTVNRRSPRAFLQPGFRDDPVHPCRGRGSIFHHEGEIHEKTFGGLFLALLAAWLGAADCTTVGAAGSATRDGVTILAKNRDYPADTGQILFFETDRQFAPGEQVSLQTLRVGQAPATWQLLGFKALDDRAREKRLWRWGLGMGMNRSASASPTTTPPPGTRRRGTPSTTTTSPA